MHRTSRIVALSVVGLVWVLGSCKRGGDESSTSSGGGSSAERAALLKGLGECALSGYKEFAIAAGELDAAAKKVEAEGTPAARDAAREAWRKTIDTWERMEPFTWGPAGLSGTPGGQDLRDTVYAWPLFNRCQIEVQLVEQTYAKPEFASALVTTRGLGASEFLLFFDGTDNACGPGGIINSSGSWAALGAPEIVKRKNAYLRAVSADTLAQGQKLADAWDPAKGNFLGEMVNAGTSRSYPTQQNAFNAVSDAFFYVDLLLKNNKIGLPAGLIDGCAAPPCLANVESPYAKRSKDHIRNNLIGAEKLFNGCTANGGFAGLLELVGGDAVSAKVLAGLADARAKVDALTEPTFEDDLVKNAAGVKALFESLRNLATILKSEFVTVLDLELPKPAASDND